MESSDQSSCHSGLGRVQALPQLGGTPTLQGTAGRRAEPPWEPAASQPGHSGHAPAKCQSWEAGVSLHLPYRGKGLGPSGAALWNLQGVNGKHVEILG